MEREEELGRYTIGNTKEDMTTVRSRIYLNGLSVGDYKLVDDNSLELNFSVSETGVSSNIKENISTGTFGNIISTAVAELILTIQTGGYSSKIIMTLIFITMIVSTLLVIKKKMKKEN